MRQAVVEDFASLEGLRVVTTLDHRLPDPPGPWTTVRVGPDEEPSTFARLSDEVDFTLLIAPETGGLLLDRARRIEQGRGRSLGSSPEAIALTTDKAQLGEHLRANGIPTPSSLRLNPSNGLPASFPYPAVLKPVDGAGAVRTFFITAADAMPQEALDELSDALLQPFESGVSLSASFLVSSTGRADLVGMGRQWVRRDRGRFSYHGGTVPYRHDVPGEEIRRAVESVPGLRGWVGVDFLWEPARGKIMILEINPRLTTSYVGWRCLFSPRVGLLACRWLWALEHPELLETGRGFSTARPFHDAEVHFQANGSIDFEVFPRIRGIPSMTTSSSDWLALDIGGANIKAAHTTGQARTLPFELWKRPEELPRVLESLVATFPPFERIAVTMTAELCDCYPTKAEGVTEVLGAVLNLAEERSIRVWSIDERFHSVAEILKRPALAAASNWLALAMMAARLVPEGPGLLIDIGSTTTDLIPLDHGRPVPRGRTDWQRLRTHELVYAGIRRTPVCALATELPWRGALTGLSAELFATTLDIFVTLGDIAPDPADLATADGRPATVEGARDRLARMVGADRLEFSLEDASELARAAEEALMRRLSAAAERACEPIGRPRAAVVSGSGAFLARRLARSLIEPGGAIVDIEAAWGPVGSIAACAYALVVLANERNGDLDQET